MPDELTEEQRKVIDALNLTGNVASFMGPAVPTMNPILRALIGVGQDVVKDVEQTVPTQYEATSRILEGLNSANQSIEDYGGRLAYALERENNAMRSGLPPDQGLIGMATELGLAASPLSAGARAAKLMPPANPNAWRSGPPPAPKAPPPRQPMPMQDANALNRPPALPPAQQIARGPQPVSTPAQSPGLPASQQPGVPSAPSTPARPPQVQAPSSQQPAPQLPQGRNQGQSSRSGGSQKSKTLSPPQKKSLKKAYFEAAENNGSLDVPASELRHRLKVPPQQVEEYVESLKKMAKATGHSDVSAAIRALREFEKSGAKFAAPTAAAGVSTDAILRALNGDNY